MIVSYILIKDIDAGISIICNLQHIYYSDIGSAIFAMVTGVAMETLF